MWTGFVVSGDDLGTMSDFLKTLRERVIVYDRAMGTSVQVRQPSIDDFCGNEGRNEGRNEIPGGQVFRGV
jgi:methionine synthase I (cobalamin-dependent)